MIVSTELMNEMSQKVRIEVETSVPSDHVRVLIKGGSSENNIVLTRKEAAALRICLSDI